MDAIISKLTVLWFMKNERHLINGVTRILHFGLFLTTETIKYFKPNQT